MNMEYDTSLESLLYEIVDLDGEGPFDCPVCKYDNSNEYDDPESNKVRALKSWHTDPPLMNRRYHCLVEMTCVRCGHKFQFEDESY